MNSQESSLCQGETVFNICFCNNALINWMDTMCLQVTSNKKNDSGY